MLTDLPRPLNCLSEPVEEAGVVYGVREGEAGALAVALRQDGFGAAADALLACGFTGAAGDVRWLAPGQAVIGLGNGAVHAPIFGALATQLPRGTVWRLAADLSADFGEEALLGFCMGAYRPGLMKADAGSTCLLVPPSGCAQARQLALAVWLARDLINLPPNMLGPADLAQTASRVSGTLGMRGEVVAGAALSKRYPLLAHAGHGASRAPAVFVGRWQSPRAEADAPLISLCGKGVIFDSGGLDIKPASGMLRMKKDMAGAAVMLALAVLIMARDLPVRLELRLGCIENAISGNAMRPSDVVRARSGLTVEIGNTDAEGRLVLADLLTEASEVAPDVLLDAATLTGAARVALGPEITALFTDNDALAGYFAAASGVTGEAIWRLPLHSGYASQLESGIADICNVSDKPHAGAVIAALFLQRFVTGARAWAHLDIFAWNESVRAGRPAGGEAEGLRNLITVAEALALGEA